tara:strand:- start:325 stop:1323 length:999 start_codon:yes stop_codon:yes gene_type:complete
MLFSCSSSHLGKVFYNASSQGQVAPAFVTDSQIESSKKIVPSIAESSYLSDNSFGPSKEFPFVASPKTHSSEVKARDPIIGVFLGPGLQRTMVFLDLFKELQKQGISVHVLSGTGFGNVIAGLMASEVSFGRAEWVLFKFWNKSKNYEAYSKKWYGVLEDIVLKEFDNSDIQSFGRLVFLPSAMNNGKKHFFKIGKPRDIFKKIFFQLERNKRENWFIHFDREVFLKRGVDIIIHVNVLGSEVTLSKPNDFLKKALDKFAMEKKGSLMFNHHDLYFEFLEGEGVSIDSLISRKKWEKDGQAWARRTAKRVRDVIKVWKEKSLKSKDFNGKGR